MDDTLKGFCQSCGMPLDEAHKDLIGKEKNGSDSRYCKYCYDDGVFADPGATLEDMVEINLKHMKGFASEEEARAELYKFLPKLSRWAK